MLDSGECAPYPCVVSEGFCLSVTVLFVGVYRLLLLQYAVENLTAGDASKAELSPLK